MKKDFYTMVDNTNQRLHDCFEQFVNAKSHQALLERELNATGHVSMALPLLYEDAIKLAAAAWYIAMACAEHQEVNPNAGDNNINTITKFFGDSTPEHGTTE
jgi:hypothetical protein